MIMIFYRDLILFFVVLLLEEEKQKRRLERVVVMLIFQVSFSYIEVDFLGEFQLLLKNVNVYVQQIFEVVYDSCCFNYIYENDSYI